MSSWPLWELYTWNLVIRLSNGLGCWSSWWPLLFSIRLCDEIHVMWGVGVSVYPLLACEQTLKGPKLVEIGLHYLVDLIYGLFNGIKVLVRSIVSSALCFEMLMHVICSKSVIETKIVFLKGRGAFLLVSMYCNFHASLGQYSSSELSVWDPIIWPYYNPLHKLFETSVVQFL